MKKRQQRQYAHGITVGIGVEILRPGKPHRCSRESGIVRLIGRAGFQIEGHPVEVYYFHDLGRTWRHWADHEGETDADAADVESANNPNCAA